MGLVPPDELLLLLELDTAPDVVPALEDTAAEDDAPWVEDAPALEPPRDEDARLDVPPVEVPAEVATLVPVALEDPAVAEDAPRLEDPPALEPPREDGGRDVPTAEVPEEVATLVLLVLVDAATMDDPEPEEEEVEDDADDDEVPPLVAVHARPRVAVVQTNASWRAVMFMNAALPRRHPQDRRPDPVWREGSTVGWECSAVPTTGTLHPKDPSP